VGTFSSYKWDSSGNYATAASYQTLDAYGNLVQQQVYDFGSSTVTRTYNFSYITDTNYTSRYIRNRLLSATVTSASGTLTLASNTYDGTGCGVLQDPPGAPGSIPFHDANYSTSFTYRGNPTSVTNLGTSTCYAYQTTGVMYQMQNAAGPLITTAPSASTSYSLPGVVTPNGCSVSAIKPCVRPKKQVESCQPAPSVGSLRAPRLHGWPGGRPAACLPRAARPRICAGCGL